MITQELSANFVHMTRSFVIDEVLDIKEENKDILLKVGWGGFDRSQASWEPFDGIWNEALEAVTRF